MDAAVARLEGSRPYGPYLHGCDWVITGVERPRLGMRLVKSGRSSGITKGRIDGLSLSTNISWGPEQHYFDDQIHVVPPGRWPDAEASSDEVSRSGDSGAVWVHEATGKAIGLHFAGDLNGVPEDEHALANPIWRVVDALGVQFTPPTRQPPAKERDAPLVDDLVRGLRAAGVSTDAVADLVRGVGATTGASRQDSRKRESVTAELEALRALIDVFLAELR